MIVIPFINRAIVSKKKAVTIVNKRHEILQNTKEVSYSYFLDTCILYGIIIGNPFGLPIIIFDSTNTVIRIFEK